MFDIREKSIMELKAALDSGEITSVELVKAYLARIAKYDSGKINSVLEINPDALFMAEKCDIMRAEGSDEGPLFGIPVMIKDNIDTCDKMHTTAGSLALVNNKPFADSGVVHFLRHSGAILLGKTNMTEYANFMTDKMPSGYSSRGGQVINPYCSMLTPSGSSSGSGVATACSFAAACVGTETNGSIISPSKNNCIVGIKPTVGLVPRNGIIPISHTQDTAGPMARSVEDAAILLTAISGMDNGDEATICQPPEIYNLDYYEFTKKSVEGMRIGYVVDAPLNEREQESMDLAVKTLTDCGAVMIPIELKYNPVRTHYRTVMLHEFKAGVNAYLSASQCDMKNLSDIIEYNKAHSTQCLVHGQTLLEASDAKSGRLCEAEYLTALVENLECAQNAIDNALADYDIDLFIQANYNAIHAVSGYPCVTVPTGISDRQSGRNILFVGAKWSEGTLITAAHAFEKASQRRIAPELFTLELAHEDEKDAILELYKSKLGFDNTTWSEEYPTMDNIEHDMEGGNLYVYKNEFGELVGTISIEDESEDDDGSLNWSKKGNFTYLARMCVKNDRIGRNLGEDILREMFKVCRAKGFTHCRWMASISNPKVIHMYDKMLCRRCGECTAYGIDFIGYEYAL